MECKNFEELLYRDLLISDSMEKNTLKEFHVASLRVFMATLRKKLESEPNSPQYIQTHIGIGYRMLKV